MPFGLLNEHHEPTNFYGVQRNFVETLIIPSTWREGGFNVHGDTDAGFSWNAGLTTGFDLSKWDYAPEFPQYATALDLEDKRLRAAAATHQELALANAHDLSQYVRSAITACRPVAGRGDQQRQGGQSAGSANAPIQATSASHCGKRTRGGLRASSTYRRYTPWLHRQPGRGERLQSRSAIPSLQFYGYFAQAAYGLWEHGDYRLAPFARWERYDMGARYAGTTGPEIPSGLVPSRERRRLRLLAAESGRVWTVGATSTPRARVFKADYQWFDLNSDFNRFDWDWASTSEAWISRRLGSVADDSGSAPGAMRRRRIRTEGWCLRRRTSHVEASAERADPVPHGARPCEPMAVRRPAGMPLPSSEICMTMVSSSIRA